MCANEELLLAALKTDLGITTTAYDERLLSRLHTAREEIAAEGVRELNLERERDRDLLIMYAAWRWRERASGADMPRMLRYALNNRIFGGA